MANPIKKVSEIGDVITNAISVAASKKEFILKQAINGALVFLILLVLGCLDFATLTFHFEYLFQASYWGTVITKTIVGLLAFNLGINIMWDYELQKDLILALAIRKYNYLILQRENDFEYYVVHVFNPEEKKKAYLSQINHKIYLLNKISRKRDRLLYSSDLPEKQEEKKTNKYCIRRGELEALKTDEYIEKNLASLVVSYQEVDATVFELEIDGSPVVRGVKTRGNTSVGRAKATSTTLLSMVLFSMFITVIGLEFDKNAWVEQMVSIWHYLAKCAADVFVVLWQLSRGMLRTRKIISSELTQPYAGRNKVLINYLKWRTEQGKMTEQDYLKVLTKLKEIDASQSRSEKVEEEIKPQPQEKVLELTPEQAREKGLL